MASLIVGCGYLGFRVARSWAENNTSPNGSVFAISRSQDRIKEWQSSQLRGIQADLAEPTSLTGLRTQLPSELDCVLFAVGFDRSAGYPIDRVYVDGLQALVRHLPPVRQFVYISSTGVYGQQTGEWVDETSHTEPQTAGGQACLRAEAFLAEADGVAECTTVLRLAGIYGPQRVPRLADIRGQLPITGDPQSWLNLIHVDDAVTVVNACRQQKMGGRFLVSDGQPVLRGDYYREIAKLAGVDSINLQPPTAGSPKAARGLSNKRISNQKMTEQLGVQLHYPTYREGLQHALN